MRWYGPGGRASGSCSSKVPVTPLDAARGTGQAIRQGAVVGLSSVPPRRRMETVRGRAEEELVIFFRPALSELAPVPHAFQNPFRREVAEAKVWTAARVSWQSRQTERPSCSTWTSWSCEQTVQRAEARSTSSRKPDRR